MSNNLFFIADFHIHSKYSRATSPNMNLEHLSAAAQVKGIKVLSAGDFTHPAWFKELKEKLSPVEPGLYELKVKSEKLKVGERTTRFILTTEISCIYSKAGKVRKVHVLIFAPDLATVEKINTHLGRIGNLKADGRPILGLDAKELLKIVLEANENCLVVPCHAWTPWFSVFGSKSGFDSLEECFEEQTKNIFAIETGLSSDPAMNWRLSFLDKVALISCSDAHSPAKLGREACVFDIDLSYPAITEAIKSKNPKKFLYTIEFFPEEGKYHYDGHRLCNVSFSPKETMRHNGLCPKCSRPLTVGVLNRVERLADRPEGFQLDGAVPFHRFIPLVEVIAGALGVGVSSKAVAREYEKLVKHFGSEFNILLSEIKPSELEDSTQPEIARAIILMKDGRVLVEPGYDGEYGKIKILTESKRRSAISQKALF